MGKPGRPKGSIKKGIKYLDVEELSKLLRSARQTNRRDWLILKLCSTLGLRVQEVSNLKKEDVDPQVKTIDIAGLKNGQKKNYKLKHSDYKKLWTALRSQLKKKPSSPWLFPSSRRDGPLTTQALKNLYKKYNKRAHLRSELSIHSLRHSCGVLMAQAGMNPQRIRDWLRHQREETTAIYYRQARFEDTANHMGPVFKKLG